MNLAANSRDAMPQGGRFTVETSPVYLDEDYVEQKQAAIAIGHYILLTVSDTGIGIPANDLPHIFEPFYTAKSTGQGSALGLATVYGIVKQNHGFVWAYSEPGMGTIFRIYLPCVDKRAIAAEPANKSPEVALPGTETLLLVEDEEAVRRSSAEYLGRCGYTVLEAKDGIAHPLAGHRRCHATHERRPVGRRTGDAAPGYESAFCFRLRGQDCGRPQSGGFGIKFPAETVHLDAARQQGALGSAPTEARLGWKLPGPDRATRPFSRRKADRRQADQLAVFQLKAVSSPAHGVAGKDWPSTRRLPQDPAAEAATNISRLANPAARSGPRRARPQSEAIA